ncbi:MAG: spermidine/putrescine ABC transporter substrate-binding protein [Gammaproteobacteria bacterium]|nr:spermidine/putrescine ABC transporter substrate-binding protein [Gammaproteobacteria bacterium]MCY4218017.1 spermidine/putrescine ABC transporter substrate-binding protein [Gammaproteobacteria bacterium]MCY4274410.1 spermidine/putrescine ABC transporter substrate-binding protein [Gammaproteobacteria bacterium]
MNRFADRDGNIETEIQKSLRNIHGGIMNILSIVMRMRTKILAVCFASLLPLFTLTATMAPLHVAAQELNALVWCDHADDKFLQPFEETHNVKVNVKTYEGTGAALSIIEQSSPGDWDVLVVDAPDAPTVAGLGLLQPFDESQLPINDLFPDLTQAPFNYLDGKRYTVPEKFGYYGVAYNKDKVDPEDMKTADVMWNSKYKGRVAVYDYYFPTMQLVAISMGIAPDNITLDDLEVIRERLLAMKPNIKMVGDIVSVQNALVNGDVDIILNAAEFVVSGLMPTLPNLDWNIFEEGGLMWIQGLSIFKDSKNKDLALEFVKYVISPEGQSRLATSECYWAMPSNSKTQLSDAEREILRWEEQPSYLARSVPSTISRPEIDSRMLDIWTEFLQK